MITDKRLNNEIMILIAEDSRTQRAVLEYVLQEQGYQVVATSNGKEALEAAKKQKPDLIISDVVMPEMDGVAFCKAVKDDAALKDIPFMLMSALEEIEDSDHDLESGAYDLIYKPYDSKSLLARIEAIRLNKAPAMEKRQQKRTPMFSSDPVDPSCLKGIVGDDKMALREILMDFKHANDKDILLLIAAIKNNDLIKARLMAHRIKGACQLVGAEALGIISQQIEDASARGNADKANQLMITFQHEVNQLKTWLESM